MTRFDIKDLDPTMVPQVDVDLDAVLCAIESASPADIQSVIRVGSVWERKEYPDGGSVSPVVSPSPYRNVRIDDILITVSVLFPGDYLRLIAPEVEQLVEQIKVDSETAKIAAETKRKQEIENQIAALRAEADKLEGKL